MSSRFIHRVLFILVALALVLGIPHMAMAQVTFGPLPPQSFERSIIFVDGTNLFYRFEEMKLLVGSFYQLFLHFLGGKGRPSIRRICWYTIEEKYQRTLNVHGDSCLDRIRVIHGTGVPTSGEPKEKGVDS